MAERRACSLWPVAGSWLVLAALVAAAPARAAGEPAAGPSAPPAWYQRRGTLEETLTASRQAYARQQADNSAARRQLTFAAWHQAMPAYAPRLGGAVVAAAAALGEKAPAGQPLWAAQPWKDGGLVRVEACGGQPATACLARVITAQSPVRLLVGVGGGIHLELCLNGKRVWAGETRLPTDRYGTGQLAEGSHVDQVVLPLDLPAGQNLLAVRVQIDRDNQFYFSASPARLEQTWKQVRADFAPADNPLLAWADAEWFDHPGWFGAADAALEVKLAERLVEQVPPEVAERLRKELAALSAGKVAPTDPRWLALCVRAADAADAHQAIGRLGRAVQALKRQFPSYPAGDFQQRLDRCAERLRAAPADQAARRCAAATALRDELHRLRRQALVHANPLLAGRRILFVKRYTYNSQHYYDDYYHGVRKFGGNLCELSLEDGSVREILPELRDGVFDRYDLSFDARRVAFGYRPPRSGGFRIYEAGVDGRGLRQLTFPPPDEEERIARYSMHPLSALDRDPLLYGHWTDDMHPCYLSDGGIAFVSSRCERSVLCGGHSLTTTCLYRMEADGRNPHPISTSTLSEFTPTMMSDGRILYNRWEYVYKGIAAVQPLWAMRPDGSSSEEVYGDNVAEPGVFVQARQVPGHDNLIVCLGCGHEPLAVGTILLLDLDYEKRTREPMTFLTPDTTVRNLRGLFQRRNGRWREDVYGPFYCDPYPLSEAFFLVSCNPTRRYNDPGAYGLYLLDAFGNQVEIHRDAEMSCFPPVLPTAHAAARVQDPAPAQDKPKAKEDQATLLLADVYQGLTGVPRGTVKYLRVLEQIPRPWSAWQGRGEDGVSGQMVAVSWFTHIWIAVLHGIVPVEADGSAHFTVPAGRNLYLQALDENFMEVQRMRTFVNFQPGERRSCIGCHEPRSQAPPPNRPTASLHAPVAIAPQPGDSGPRPLHYPTDVQPILDRHCVRCHSGPKPKAALDLSPTLTTHFNRSYESIMEANLVNAIQEWAGRRKGGWQASMENVEAVPAYSLGSHKSKLIAHLRKGHSDVKLSREEWVRLVTWIDVGAPYYGSYFGRRHLRHKDNKDFRPAPTLASACGQAPPPPPRLHRPDVPARLVAHWTFDLPAGQAGEASGDLAADACDNAHPARLVGLQRAPGRRGGAIRLDGLGYVQAGGLGSLETLSVAMWVKPGRLEHTWTPLLFTDNWKPASFHFSLLPDGRLNLAVNSGSDLHNASRSGLGDPSGAGAQWHHVAVVCDSRSDGVVRFYIDGRRDREVVLDASVAPLLDSLRIGAYNGWQGRAKCNFHGLIDDVRVYSGMISDAEAAELAR
ncbi:MAG: hypothetical protein BWX88_04096 [Planctomycetes bacterium ADurb.Bin126]|nr:MAG: hypothetical protein BWX88_04096 [Planctomycetes bacterium ADurb.Bin126]